MKIKKIMSNQIYSLHLVWKYSKQIFLFKFISSCMSGIVPTLTAYIYKLIVEKITLGNVNSVFLTITILGVVLFTDRLIHNLISKHASIKSDSLRNGILFSFLEKTVNMDYEILYSPSVTTKKEMAEKAVRGNYITGYIDNIFASFSSIISIVSVSFILSTISIWVFIILLILLIFKIIITLVDKKVIYNTQEKLAPINKEITYYMNVFFNESTANELRMYSLSNLFIKKYNILITKMQNLFKKLVSRIFKTDTLRNILMTLEQVFLYAFLAIQMLYYNMTFADFTMSLSALNTISSQFGNFINCIINLYANSKYIDDYRNFMSIENKIAIENYGISCNDIKETDKIYTFKNVSFKYPTSNDYVLKNVNLTFEKNKLYVIVGKNGVGKSTLCKILCRLYDVSSGELYFNDKNLKKIEYRSYRNNIGIVFQNYKYYEMSIAENVALDEYKNTDEIRKRIIDCLSKAGLLEKINSLPKGIDTNLGTSFDENGILLSGGETQKLALARVLFKNSPIVILDEPSSALDPLSESELLDTFVKALKDKTIFYVSHRLSVVSQADKILFLQNNAVSGFDTHENLLKTNSSYYEMYYAQAKYYNLK